MDQNAAVAVVVGALCLGVGFVAVVGICAVAFFMLRDEPTDEGELAAEELPDGYPEILQTLAAQTQDAIQEAKDQTEYAIQRMRRNSTGGDYK